MDNAEQSRILVVDDDRALTKMLTELLATEGFECSVAHSGKEALTSVAEQEPDLVILDVMMPGDDGIATLRHLRESTEVPVLMLTAMGEDDDRVLGLEAGADDYLAKPFVARELVLRIRAILKRAAGGVTQGTKTGELSAGALKLSPEKELAFYGDSALRLTGAELRVLELLMRHAGNVVGREQLTESALGRKLSPYDRALDTHISHLRSKLASVSDQPRCEIRSVRGTGYKLVLP